MKEAKIVELAKKNRKLTVALEREKMARQRVEKELHTLQTTASGMADSKSKSGSRRGGGAVDDHHAGLASPEDSSKANRLLQKKLDEARGTIETLRVELKRSHLILKQEVGDEAQLEKALSVDGWKGRAEQIRVLKSRVKELKKDLQTAQAAQPMSLAPEHSPRYGGRSPIPGGNPLGPNVNIPGSLDDFDERHKREYSRISKDRMSELQSLTTELERTRNEQQEMKFKLDASLSRNKTLDTQIANLKSKMAILLEKLKNDDQLIDALKVELEVARRRSGPGISPGAKVSELQQQITDLNQQVDRQQQIILSLRKEAGVRAEEFTNPVFQNFSSVKAQALELEVAKNEELIGVLKMRLADFERTTNELMQKNRMEKSHARELERRLAAAPPQHASRDQLTMLTDKCASLSEEIQQLRETHRMSQTAKDEEVALLRQLLNQNKTIFEKGLAELQANVQAHGTLQGSTSSKTRSMRQ